MNIDTQPFVWRAHPQLHLLDMGTLEDTPTKLSEPLFLLKTKKDRVSALVFFTSNRKLLDIVLVNKTLVDAEIFETFNKLLKAPKDIVKILNCIQGQK